jgi:hypothetical protein
VRPRDETRAERNRWDAFAEVLSLLSGQVGRAILPHPQVHAGI